MKRAVLILVLLPTLLAGVALAQEVVGPPETEPTLAEVQIALWPEYDRPEMLVIEQGRFAVDTALPVRAEFRIPASVGKPHALAYVDDAGERLTQPYASRVEGSWLVLSLELPSLAYQLEYYAPLKVHGDERSFVYTYTAEYSTTALTLQAQVPPTAQDYALSPPASSEIRREDGLLYHVASAGPLPQGASRTWAVSYRKADAGLTVPAAAPVEPQASGGTAEPGRASNSTVWIFVVAFLALVGVGAGAFWLGRRVSPSTPTAVRGWRDGGPNERFSPGSSRPGLERPLFCSACGARLRADSVYCHKCGAEVRERDA